jgi:hypothetical protein
LPTWRGGPLSQGGKKECSSPIDLVSHSFLLANLQSTRSGSAARLAFPCIAGKVTETNFISDQCISFSINFVGALEERSIGSQFSSSLYLAFSHARQMPVITHVKTMSVGDFGKWRSCTVRESYLWAVALKDLLASRSPPY